MGLTSLDTEELPHKLEKLKSPRNLKKIAAALAILSILSFFLLPSLLGNKPTITVLVKDAKTGELIEGANVLLIKDGAVLGFKRTRIAGRVEFNAPAAPGYSARVEAAGFKSKQLAGLKQKNEVALELNAVNAQAGSLKQPSTPTPAFNLPAGKQNASIAPPAITRLEENYSKSPDWGAAPFEPAQVTEPDCLQINAPATPSPPPQASPTAGTTPTPQQPQASPSATPASPPSTTPQAPPSPSNSSQEVREISLKYGESTQLESQKIEFLDYAPDGKVRLRITGGAATFSAVLSKEPNQTNSIELAAGKLELVSSSGEPPTAIFRLYSKSGTATPASVEPAGGSASPPASNATSKSGNETGGSEGTQSPAASPPRVAIETPNADFVLTTRTPVAGSASSSNGIFLVELSTDGGKTWAKARGGSKWASEIGYPRGAGPLSVKARATDCKGNAAESGELRLHASACVALVYHGPHEKKYDLTLIPSKYGGDLEKFTADSENALEAVFSTPPFNTLELYSKFNIFLYNGEAECEIAGGKPPENRAWKCSMPKEYYEACPFADQATVFVNSELRAGKSGNPIVASAGERSILVHELGHSTFGLADEYCCDGGYWEKEPQPNIFKTMQECKQSTNKQCFELGQKGWSHVQVERGLMEALEKKFFDESDLPAIKAFNKKYE